MLQPKDTDWLKGYKNKTHKYAVYKKPTSDLKTHYRLKVRGWKNIFHANGKQKNAGVAILISDKIELNIKNTTRDKEGQFNLVQFSHSVRSDSATPWTAACQASFGSVQSLNRV